MNVIQEIKGPDIGVFKARQKATWETGDFGQIAKFLVPTAEEFIGRLALKPGMRVLDVACGTGNLAVVAARLGCDVVGVDIASNLIAQARERAQAEDREIEFIEGDAEALPCPDEHFDAVVSMYGAMFAPRPDVTVAEMFRVAKPGGIAAMANWTPEGFVGKMFGVVRNHLPPPPPGIPSPLQWGVEPAVRARLGQFASVRIARRIALMRYPFPPAETVEHFRRYFGPTAQAFQSLPPSGHEAFRKDLVELQTSDNKSKNPNETEVHAEYLEIIARR